ncbi:hypothetical protein [Hyphomonas sp.]|uniref:hypothetical protein n=1 Tax=Hyphomonas sp. TaxID=87 RepID=UPI0025C42280|nr:hypothetical protein [Hyphomonas sp.]
MTDTPVLTLDEAARRLGRARQAHDRAPHDEKKYQALLEAEIEWQKADARRIRQELAVEKNGRSALRRQLDDATAAVARLREAKTESLRAAKAAAKPKRKRVRTETPLFDGGL